MRENTEMREIAIVCNDCIVDILDEYNIYDEDVVEILLDLVSIITGELHKYMKGRREGEY